MRKSLTVLLVLFCLSVFVGLAVAGNINPPGPPSAGSGMITMKQLYDYLTTGMAPPVPGLFKEPVSGPGSTGKSIQEIYEGIKNEFDSCPATPDDVRSGIEFFSTDPDFWGPVRGNYNFGKKPGEPCLGGGTCQRGSFCVSSYILEAGADPRPEDLVSCHFGDGTPICVRKDEVDACLDLFMSHNIFGEYGGRCISLNARVSDCDVGVNVYID